MRPKGALGIIRLDADHVDKIPPFAIAGERLSFLWRGFCGYVRIVARDVTQQAQAGACRRPLARRFSRDLRSRP
jgi:hypothetical protein